MVMITLYAKQKKRHRCTEQNFGLWEKARVGCLERTALKHVYYLGWNRSPAHVGCMRQVLGPGALGRPRGIRWRGRWERGSGWGTHVNPWLIHVDVWQKPLQYCKVISLQLIKKKKRTLEWVAISFSRGSSRPRDGPWVSCLAGRLFTGWALGEASFQRSALCSGGGLSFDTDHSSLRCTVSPGFSYVSPELLIYPSPPFSPLVTGLFSMSVNILKDN